MHSSAERQERKRTIRREVRAARRLAAKATDRPDMPPAVAVAIAAAAAPLWETAGSRGCVAAYQALPTEPPTDALIASALAAGLQVIVPELLPDNDLDWRPVGADGVLGARLGRDAIAAAGVVIVPALAVDRSGTRLGQGGGSYDRALVRRSPTALVVAVVGDAELVDGPLPADAHDVAVHAVITPGGGFQPLPSPGWR